MVGGVCYVDLFARNLDGIRAKIPYFKELGLTYLHLMPLFRMPEGENDGGYAISSFREVHPPLGTMAQLAQLSRALREEGISLVLDLIINHTADEHEWAERAKAGEARYEAMYGICLLYTSDAADDLLCVDLGGRRIIKNKQTT